MSNQTAMNMDIPIKVQRHVLKNKIALHRVEYFGYTSEAQVAQSIGGLDAMFEEAQERMKTTLAIIAGFQKLLDELPNEEGPIESG